MKRWIGNGRNRSIIALFNVDHSFDCLFIVHTGKSKLVVQTLTRLASTNLGTKLLLDFTGFYTELSVYLHLAQLLGHLHLVLSFYIFS